MEFPIGAETNGRVFDELSTCHWKVYGVDSNGSGLGTSGSSVNQLFKKIQICALALREAGCLTCPSSDGTGIWVFSLDAEFSRLKSFASNQSKDSEDLVVGQVPIYEYCGGTTSIAELSQKLLSKSSENTRNSSLAETLSSRNKLEIPASLELTHSSLYASFISSIAWSLSLHLTRRHGAIPLGKRTFFTAADSDMSSGSTSTSVISTLDIELSQSGKVIISLRSRSQPGITQLSEGPGVSSISELRLHDDIWLAPAGTIARYIGIGGSEYALGTGNSYHSNNIHGSRNGFSSEGQDPWKLAVCSWLERTGVPIEISDNMRWVQVEVVTRHQRLGQGKAAGTRRIYWPAQLCFKKARFPTSSPIQGAETLSRDSLGPLQYARQWLKCSVPRDEVLSRNAPSDVAQHPEQHPQSETLASPDGIDVPNTTESMARALVCPDFHPATVYPTPPGGALGFGQLASDHSGGQYPLELSHIPREDPDTNITESLNPNTRSLLEETSPGLGAGTGMYDTADDDLFEEMDDNFDSKGITEADFNFFDEPGLSDTNLDVDSGNPSPSFVIPDHPTAESKPDLEMSESLASLEPAPPTKPHGMETPMLDNAVEEGANQGQSEIKSSQTTARAADTDRDSERPISPPLSPSGVKRILFSSPRGSSEKSKSSTISATKLPVEASNQSGQHKGRYDAISFQHELDFSDRKYGIDGRFWFLPDHKTFNHNTDSHTTKIPMVNDPPAPVYKLGQQAYHKINERLDNADSERCSSSTSSTSSVSGDHYEQAGFNKMRPVDPIDNRLRRGDLEEIFSVTSSLQSPGFNVRKPYPTHSDLEEDVLLAGLVYPATDWLLSSYFTAFEPSIRSALCGRDETLHVAQLLVDQITQSTLTHKTEIAYEENEKDNWQASIDDINALGQSRRPSLKSYASISDIGPSQQMKDATGAIVSLRPPHVHIRRGNCSLEVLPTAISFWETFGLEPLKGKKDIISYCLHPVSMQESANAFLDRLGLTYSGANLGTFARHGSAKGLVPWSLSQDKLDYTSIMRKLQHICESLGTALSNLSMNNKTVVVCIVNPFKIGAAMVDICVAFLRLFRKYVEEADKRSVRRPNELVLQIVPSEFITGDDSLVIPTQNDYLRLALEIYSRCPPQDPISDMFAGAPAFALATSVPKMIPFRLTAEEGSPMDAGQACHVAYSVSQDQRWVTAAWCDNLGLRQLTLSYSLRQDVSHTCRPLSEVREDIWQVMVDMTGMSRCRWRVVLAKDEPMDAEEITAWTNLAARHNQHHSGLVDLILLTVNTEPNLHLKLPPPPPQLNALYQSGNASTPVSTPKPSISSPDPSTSAPTPPNISNTPNFSSELSQPQAQSHFQVHPTQISVETNTETLLVDKSDDSWALVLSQRLNNSHSFTNYKPALANGYLIHRSGTSDTDWKASLMVNLIHLQSRIPPSIVLKDLLEDLPVLGEIMASPGTFLLPLKDRSY
ncbi:mediator of RNA polymerase II transcription subunit 13 [Trichophyton mentagrophytes]|nr:mediator of RNA polymerase II transcription subunit 13 [Trichophyton mentagrophytes]